METRKNKWKLGTVTTVAPTVQLPNKSRKNAGLDEQKSLRIASYHVREMDSRRNNSKSF